MDLGDGLTQHEDGSVTLTKEAADRIGAWVIDASRKITALTDLLNVASKAMDQHVGIAKALDRASDFLVLHQDEPEAIEAANDIRSILKEYGW